MDNEGGIMSNQEELDYNFSILEAFNFAIDTDSQAIIGRNAQNREVCYMDPVPVKDSSNLEDIVKYTFTRTLYENRNTKELTKLQRTIGVDYRLLDQKGIDAIVNLYNEGFIYGIKLLPEGIKLSQEIYNKLNSSNLDDNFVLIVDSTEIDSRFDTRVQNGIIKIEKTEIFDKSDEQFKLHNNIHINRELTDEELRKVVRISNEKNYDNIFFNFYDPSYYEDTLKKLNDYGLNSNTTITFLANPLYDVMELYSNLDQTIENPIKIHYNTCNDLNEFYKERVSELQNYYSDIEASDVCDLDSYKALLNSVTSINNHLESKQYSNLEKIAYVYDYFKENYIYNPDYKPISHHDNAALHIVSQKDRMICEGFSNLMSCILRRNGIYCFTVGVDDHQYNVVRVTDKKYGIDNLALMDVTFDIGDEKRINDKFKNFLRPLDAKLYDYEPSTLNLASALYISEEDYRKYCPDSNPGYVRYPFGFAVRMFELMGLGISKENATPNEIRSAFLNSNLKDIIPKRKIVEAINKVRIEEGNQIQSDYDSLDDRIDRTLDPMIRTNDNNGIYCNLLSPDKSTTFDKIESQTHTLYPPSNRKEFETVEDYIERIKNHFHNMFYLKKEKTNEQDNISNDEKSRIYEQTYTSTLENQDTEDNDILVETNEEDNPKVVQEIGTSNYEMSETTDEDEKALALQEYRNSGYSQNVYGYYYNVWIDEYDPDYKPWEDEIYLKRTKTR